MAGIFQPALRGLTDLSIFGPVSFRDYLTQNDLPRTDTATAISVDSYEKLAPELREVGAMVLRLGAPTGNRHTEFAIARVDERLREFFLFNEEIFAAITADLFLPSASWRQLYSFQILNRFSESALVTLALASGLLGFALGLDDESSMPAPATGHSTFTFGFRAHPEIDRELIHNAGQVEIDALFVARRNGKEALFIVEAKAGEKIRSLAKHKLVYPILALSQQVPPGMRIVPVYLHVTQAADGFYYQIVECEFPDPRQELRAITELSVRAQKHLLLPLRP